MPNTGEFRQDIILTIRTTGTTDWLGNPLSPSIVIGQVDIRNAFGSYPQITDAQYALLSDSSFIPRRDSLISTISGITSNDAELLRVTSTGYSGTLCPITIPTTTTTTSPPTTTTTTQAPLTTTTTTVAPPVNYTLNINVHPATEDVVVNTPTFKSYKRFYHLVMSPTPAAGHVIVLTYDALVIGPPQSVTGVVTKTYGVDYTSNQYVSADGTNVATGTVLVGTNGFKTTNTFTFDTAHPTHEMVFYAEVTYEVPPINYAVDSAAAVSSFTSAVFQSGSGNIALTFATVSESFPFTNASGAVSP